MLDDIFSYELSLRYARPKSFSLLFVTEANKPLYVPTVNDASERLPCKEV